MDRTLKYSIGEFLSRSSYYLILQIASETCRNIEYLSIGGYGHGWRIIQIQSGLLYFYSSLEVGAWFVPMFAEKSSCGYHSSAADVYF